MPFLEDAQVDNLANAAGQVEVGNINLNNRPRVRNADGSISTVRSMSAGMDGAEVLIPTVSDDGRVLSDADAIDLYRKTGKHLGKFDTPDNATAFAERLHKAQEQQYVTNQPGWGRIDFPKGFAVTPGASDLEDNGNKPAWNWGAAFRRNNEMAALASSESMWSGNEPEPGFNPWDKIKGTPDEVNFRALSEARNQTKFDAIKADIARENADRKLLGVQPWWMGLLTEGTAGILSPTTLLPGGTFVKGARGGIAIVKAGANVAAANAISAAVQEGALHNVEQTRTASESATAIGASLFLGGLLGAGGQAVLSKMGWQRAVKALETDLETPRTGVTPEAVLEAANSNNPALRSVGAAANDATELADNTIAGAAARATAAATAKLNPLLRALHSPSAAYRDVMLNTVENPLYLTKNFEGVASQPAVETLMKEYNGGLAKAIQATNDAYPEYRKAGGDLGKDEFREAVGKAMRRGDEDAFDPVVTRVAQEYRAKVFEPLKKQAIDAGLLPKDVSVDTAQSYFTRMWNGRKISADEQGFKGMVIEHVGKQLEKDFATSIDAHSQRMARLDQETADLNLSPEQRVSEGAKVKAALDTLEKSNPELTDVADRLSELRQRQIEASNTPSHPIGADAYKAQQKALKDYGGDELKKFMAERASLRTRKRNIDIGVAGMQERSDRVLHQIADIEDANHNTMDRILAKGQKLERDLDRLDADAFEARVNDIVESYSKVAKKADSAALRAEAQIENIKKAAEQGVERNRLLAQKAEAEALTGPPEEVAAKRSAAKEAADKNRAKQEARDANITRVLEREAERQRGLAERMEKISQRLEAARGFDHDGLMDEIRIAAEKATRETSALSLARGERIAKLSERMEAFDPAKVAERTKLIAQMKRDLETKFIDRWETGRGATDVNPAKRQAQFSEAAKQVADEVFDALTGRSGGGVRPEFITVKARGPMKERTFHIPDLFVSSNGKAVEDYLEHDVEAVARRYTRVMGADVELARKFGSVDMVDQIGKIREDYKNLRAGVSDEKQLTALAKREKDDISDLEAVRDMLRGTNPGSPTDANYSRIVRAVNHFNYLRSMGEVAIASLTETVRPAMVHGLMPYMETLGQTLGNMKGVKASVEEAQLAGNVTEKVLGTRLATLSEIIDPYASRGPVESFLENMTNVASKWNGIRLLTDMQKSIASVMSQNRLLEGASRFAEAPAKEKAYLAYMGIDQSMAERIATQFAEHGETVDKVRVANTEKWTDEVARRTYRAAINKDVDSIITTKGVADTPLFANTPTGRAMLQFKSFALASHQRVLLRGLQEGQARFVGGLIAMTTIGMMATWLKAVSGNRTEKDFADIEKKPGWLIGEGLDKAGIFAVPMELANAFEKAVGFNPIKSPIKAFDQAGAISQKNQNRSLLGSVVGPTGGLIDDATQVMGLPKKMIDGEEITQGQKSAAERLLPFSSYPGIRQMLRYVVSPPTN